MKLARPFLFYGFLFVCALPMRARAQNADLEKEPPPAGSTVGNNVAAQLAELCQKPPKRDGSPDKNAQKTSRSFLAQAKKTYDENNYVEAARALRSAFEALPQIETLFNLAQTCREGGANRQALALYQTLIAAEPEEHIESEAKRHIETLRVLVAQDSDRQGAYKLAARQFAEALALFQEAVQLDAKPRYRFHIAEAQRLFGMKEDAALSYERYLNASPGDVNQQEALGHLSRLRADVEAQRAEEHSRAGEHAQAMAAWQAAYRQDPKPIYTFRIAESARKAGVYAEALASYQRFLRETPPTDFVAEREAASRSIPQVQRDAREQKTPIHKRWWLWTLLGGATALAVVGGVTGGVLGARGNSVLPGIPVENQRVLMQLSLP